MCDRYWVLDNIWLIPILISVVAGAFIFAHKATVNLRRGGKRFSVRAEAAGMSKRSPNTSESDHSVT
jgi:hypothetical protein